MTTANVQMSTSEQIRRAIAAARDTVDNLPSERRNTLEAQFNDATSLAHLRASYTRR